MIVKKMPIFQGFPDFSEVLELTGLVSENTDFTPVFYDIETTGLGRNSSFLYLIGAVCYEENGWQMYQWLAPSLQEEKELLETFAEFLKNFRCTVQYNGDVFDQPYLEARYKLYDLPNPFEGIPSMDLYRLLRPLKGILKLNGLKQEQLETFLLEKPRIYCNGGDCIRIYKKYMSKRDQTDLDVIMGHNMEDLHGIGQILTMLSYFQLQKGTYKISGTDFDGENLIIQIQLSHPLPVPFSNNTEEFYITGQNYTVSLLIRPINGRIRQYYSDFRQYDYLPSEDMAIPKSISCFMDKKLRRSATRETCYTWFPCSAEFWNNEEKIHQYLIHTFDYLFWKLKA